MYQAKCPMIFHILICVIFKPTLTLDIATSELMPREVQ